ncbi:choice-of-anchor L domain-containing protein [Acrocarpospora sp. B8E8]|uniref:choice-of-anchor L domain-containing protein n=1 Tax=Acrocarpospora sp. B8E8 TaxID=3153572 RepID=UPI00325FCD45
MAMIFGVSLMLPGAPAVADTAQDIIAALDIDPATVVSAEALGDPSAVGDGSASIAGLPVQGGNYLVLSTGKAADVPGNSAENFISTDLESALPGADGNDLTQVKLHLRPPATASCVGFDFSFLSEEYPEYVGSAYNDVFTAELNESQFEVQDGQLIAPNNFAYDSQGNAVSINTVYGFAPVPGTNMDGATPALTATSPLERRGDGTIDLFLSIQDLGDPVYDSAVLVDNLRWLYGPTCTPGTAELTDTDGDGLSDVWETEGIDYDNDGTPEVDLPAMGADPQHRDLFIEVDWMDKQPTCVWFICWGGKNLAPQQAALDDVRAAFAAAPVSNPAGGDGIRVHVDSGPGSVMNPQTGATWDDRSRANAVGFVESLGTFDGGAYDWSAFDTIKSANFTFTRRDAFHYVLYGNTYAGSGSSGISRGIPASDLVITDGHSGWGGGFTRTQERGTFMHELGHNLALRHGGGDDVNNKPDYLSIMNYLFQLPGLPPDSRLDYSRTAPFVDWDHLRFDGGSVGDLGDSTPLPQTTEADDTLDPATAKALNAFAKDGDGLVKIVGPSLLLPSTGGRDLHIDVTNSGAVTDTFTVKVTSDDPDVTGTVSTSVGAGATKRVTVPVDTTKIAPGALHVTATLSSGKAGAGLSSDTALITVPDLSDPATRAAAEDALTRLPDAGLDPAVKAEVSDMVGKALAPITANLRLDGTLKLNRAYRTGPLSFVPSEVAPTTIKTAAPAGQPVLKVDLVKSETVNQWPFYTGTIVATAADGTLVTVSVEGTWSAKKLKFSGVWSAAGKTGSVTLTFVS